MGSAFVSAIVPGSSDLSVLQFSNSGASVWNRRFVGAGVFLSEGSGVDVDSLINVYVAGGFTGRIDFNPGPPVFNMKGLNGAIFVVKMSQP